MSSPTYLVPKQVGDLLARLPAYPGSLLFVAGLNLALTQHLASDVTAMATRLTDIITASRNRPTLRLM